MSTARDGRPRLPVVGAPVVECPACGSTTLEPVDDGYRIDYVCDGCGTRWHAELGYIQRVHDRHLARLGR